jgi:dsRNA-specific ribonuclease
MRLNEHSQRDNKVEFQPFKCNGDTEPNPKYGCKVYVNNILVGTAQDYRSKKAAKEAAAQQAVDSLILP